MHETKTNKKSLQSNLPVHKCNLIAFGVKAKVIRNFRVLLILEINQVISQETNISWEIISPLTQINFSQGNILKP